MGRNVLILAVMAALLAVSGCVSKKQKEMEAMELKAFYSEVVAKYGEPFRVLQGRGVFYAYWREKPSPSISAGCGWNAYCISCKKNWTLYKLRFNQQSKILLGVEQPFFDPLSSENVSQMPTFGMKAEDCMKQTDCRRRAEEACRNTIAFGARPHN